MQLTSEPGCEHLDFAAQVGINRLTKEEGGPVTAYSADIEVRCAACGVRFEWMGLECGMLPDRPMVDVSGTMMAAPLRPVGSDPSFGMDAPGYRVRAYVKDELPPA
ncbi:hypothetical protein [Nonomuraea salmonea]|uniref:Uncharacterized protein n=1 Tax=Nonomuraea salmonea TaxID=46181 RepID=A0ABV5P2Y0_9ACTN